MVKCVQPQCYYSENNNSKDREDYQPMQSNGTLYLYITSSETNSEKTCIIILDVLKIFIWN